MTTTRNRIPDQCPTHPEARTVKTVTRSTKFFTNNDVEHLLTQHTCGEGCGTGLGWEFHRPGGGFQAGAGRCQDQEVLAEMTLAEQEKDYTRLMGDNGTHHPCWRQRDSDGQHGGI